MMVEEKEAVSWSSRMRERWWRAARPVRVDWAPAARARSCAASLLSSSLIVLQANHAIQQTVTAGQTDSR